MTHFDKSKVNWGGRIMVWSIVVLTLSALAQWAAIGLFIAYYIGTGGSN